MLTTARLPSNSPPECRHLDEEREPATGRKKTSPGQQAEGQIAAFEEHGKKTPKKEEALALNPEENVLKNTAKPWFSNQQLSTGFGTMLRPAASTLWRRTVYRAPRMGGQPALHLGVRRLRSDPACLNRNYSPNMRVARTQHLHMKSPRAKPLNSLQLPPSALTVLNESDLNVLLLAVAYSLLRRTVETA